MATGHALNMSGVYSWMSSPYPFDLVIGSFVELFHYSVKGTMRAVAYYVGDGQLQ